ncbi:MAG: exosortase/archaeosortase family protein [Kiritimatiellae bacterium]|nr:exosortase/archaeosortase family protein [Kiritimatiellia bacterium]
MSETDPQPAPSGPAPANPRALPPGFRPGWVRLALLAAGLVLAYVLYSRFGTDSDSIHEGRSVIGWVVHQWRIPGGDFESMWVMPVVCLVSVWLARRRLAEADVRPDWRGVLVVAASLAVHVVGYRSQLPRLSLGSMVGVLWGLPFALWGPGVARALAFPACYLLLCFMSSLLVEITMPLRLMASGLACALLQGVGIGAVQQGTVVLSSAGGGFSFNVADPCSGLRSLVTMTALAAPYAYFTLKSNGKRLFLFALSVPLAMLANALRIFTLGVVAEWIGMKLAMQLYHDLSGYIVFVLSILLLVAAGSLVDRNWRALLCKLASKKRSRA